MPLKGIIPQGIYMVKSISNNMNTKVKKIVCNTVIISVLTYIMPILVDINKVQLNKINVAINKVAKHCLGYQSFKWDNNKVLNKLNWLNGTHLIYYSVLNFIHKANFDMEPKSIIDKYSYVEVPRKQLI